MIKFVIFDFDGIFTDGKVYISESVIIQKYYNVKDGLGINLLKLEGIEIGVISGYKENECQRKILEHLKIKYISLGTNEKLQILTNWCNQLNINLNEEVAFMGDDINDLEIMKNIKIVGCPKDANSKCIEISQFISTKNGGDGCIREFCEYIIEIKSRKNNFILQEIKKEINYQLNTYDLNMFSQIILYIRECIGHVYFTGIGKSGNIAKHCCDLLKSISISAFYIECQNILHGDIGTINSKDIILLFSKSGNTRELIEIIPFLKTRNIKIIGICCDLNSKFKEMCDYVFETPFINEISGKIDKIPTNSCISHLLFSNILVSILKEDINIDKYKKNHPSGSIGINLKKIKDILIFDFPKIILKTNCEFNNVLLMMTKYKIGCCFFVDTNNKLLGILTDGDIRRLLINKKYNTTITLNEINNNYYYETNINKFVSECKNISYIPILHNQTLIGIICN